AQVPRERDQPARPQGTSDPKRAPSERERGSYENERLQRPSGADVETVPHVGGGGDEDDGPHARPRPTPVETRDDHDRGRHRYQDLERAGRHAAGGRLAQVRSDAPRPDREELVNQPGGEDEQPGS